MAYPAETNQTSDTYGLTRDTEESSRLDTQHEVWKKNIGFLLHPYVEKSIGDNAHIGDVGTGTGIWLVDLAKEYAATLWS
jgi:hypothetical protein